MTVGIAFTNGLEAILITDSRVSTSGRQSDSFNKMGVFSHDDYSGVICGTGSGNFVEGMFRNLKEIKGDDLTQYVTNMQAAFSRTIGSMREQYIDAARTEIHRKARMFLPSEKQISDMKIFASVPVINDMQESLMNNHELRQARERYEKYVEQELKSFEQMYEKVKNDVYTRFMVVGYDKKAGNVKIFSFDDATMSEVTWSHYELGSGTDGANFYLESKLQGLDPKNLSVIDLAFFGVNAYNNSTVNYGVGGTPKMAVISKDGVKILGTEQTRVLTNLSGAYLSEFNSEVLTPEYMDQLFDRVLTGIPDYGKWSRSVGLNEDAFTTMYIPLSSWQERANNLRFKKDKE